MSMGLRNTGENEIITTKIHFEKNYKNIFTRMKQGEDTYDKGIVCNGYNRNQ
jgi:hypothetical protein